jgi:predicted dehydrogenase
MFLSWAASRGPLPDMVVHGERGVLHLFPRASYFDFYPNAPTSTSAFLSLVRPYWLQEKLRRPSQQRRRIALPDNDLTGYVYEVREFLSAVAEGRQPVSPPEDGRRDLEIVLDGYRALDSQQWVTVSTLGSS